MAQGATQQVPQSLKDKVWSIPPHDVATQAVAGTVIVSIVAGSNDQSILLTQAIVYEVTINVDCFMQNTSENEDDVIEWSRHGDPDGLWMRLGSSNLLEIGIGSVIYLYNRTHKQNSVMSVFVK